MHRDQSSEACTCTILRNTSTSLMTPALLNNFKHLYNSSLACPMDPGTIQCQTALSQSELSFWKLRECIDWVNLRHYKKKPPVAANSPERHTFCWTGSKLASLHYEARLLFSFERLPPAFFWGPVVWPGSPFIPTRHKRISLRNYSGKSQGMLMEVTLYFRNERYG